MARDHKLEAIGGLRVRTVGWLVVFRSRSGGGFWLGPVCLTRGPYLSLVWMCRV
jgi:hypothetical protein